MARELPYSNTCGHSPENGHYKFFPFICAAILRTVVYKYVHLGHNVTAANLLLILTLAAGTILGSIILLKGIKSL